MNNNKFYKQTIVYNKIKNKLTMKFLINLNIFFKKNIFITLLFTNYDLQVKIQRTGNTG